MDFKNKKSSKIYLLTYQLISGILWQRNESKLFGNWKYEDNGSYQNTFS